MWSLVVPFAAQKKLLFRLWDGWDTCCPVVVGVLLGRGGVGWADSDRNIDRCCLFFCPLPPIFGFPISRGRSVWVYLGFFGMLWYNNNSKSRDGVGLLANFSGIRESKWWKGNLYFRKVWIAIVFPVNNELTIKLDVDEPIHFFRLVASKPSRATKRTLCKSRPPSMGTCLLHPIYASYIAYSAVSNKTRSPPRPPMGGAYPPAPVL